MAYPTYFSDLPNIEYATSVNKSGQVDSINIKDFFHLMVIGREIYKESSLYYQYDIPNGKRPENIAYEIYGDEQYYWVILQVNEIVDYYNQWPLSPYEFESYILKKYGSWEAAGQIMHYETENTYLPDDKTLLLCPVGLVVPEVYKINDILINTHSVSYYEYELRLNKKKASINILKEAYLNDYVRETSNYFRNLPEQKSDVNISDYFT
jgi:hypothetical protein